MKRDLPPEVRRDLARAKRLEWWTLAWMLSVVFVMWLAMGSSQAMKAALIEDVLSLIPALVFLIAARYEIKRPTAAFPFGFERVHSLAALIAAVALTAVGGFLLFEAGSALLHAEHPTAFHVVSLERGCTRAAAEPSARLEVVEEQQPYGSWFTSRILSTRGRPSGHGQLISRPALMPMRPAPTGVIMEIRASAMSASVGITSFTRRRVPVVVSRNSTSEFRATTFFGNLPVEWT